VEVRDETRDARTLTLRPGRGWKKPRAGQHVRVGVVIDGRQITRTYSISSSPDRADGDVTITVKAQGAASTFLARSVLPGEHLALSLPAGDFVSPEASRLLFVTGGSGITPIMSMLRTFALRRAMPDVVHVHYAPSPAEVIFGDELRALGREHPRYRLRVVHTREEGHFVPAHLPHDRHERAFFACGPEALLEALPPGATIERYHARRIAPPAGARGGRVHLRLSGVAAAADATTPILEVAERAGASPAHGCRMGICHTCDATMLSGCVRDLRTGELIDEPGARIQPCVCAAAGDVDLDL
jgi:ferredoxin-NADP reductase